MKSADEYFNEQAYFNKWLNELTGTEKNHITDMLDDFAKDYHRARIDEVTDEDIRIDIWEGIEIPLSTKDIENNTYNYKTYLLVVQWVLWLKNKLKEI